MFERCGEEALVFVKPLRYRYALYLSEARDHLSTRQLQSPASIMAQIVDEQPCYH